MVEETKITVDEMLVQFAAENAELMQALEIFGIASAEYERALSALSPAAIYTNASTHE